MGELSSSPTCLNKACRKRAVSNARDREERWDGSLFISVELFVKRLQTLMDGGFRVVTLPEGLSRLAANALPEKSVVLTFDDGFYSFYQVAWPILKRYNLPATVYLTTYYCSYNRPVFDLISAVLRKKPTTTEITYGCHDVD